MPATIRDVAPAVVAAGHPRRNRHRVLVADGRLDRAAVTARLDPGGARVTGRG